MKRKLMILTCTVLSLCLNANRSAVFADSDSANVRLFHPGFYYYSVGEPQDYVRFLGLVNTANVSITCEALNKLRLDSHDLKTTEKSTGQLSWQSKEQIIESIRNLRTKNDLLVIKLVCDHPSDGKFEFPYPLHLRPKRLELMKSVHRDLGPFIEQLTFERIIVFANANSSQRPGVFVFGDTKAAR